MMHLSTISVLLSVALAQASSFITPNRHATNKVSGPKTPFMVPGHISFKCSYFLGAGLPKKMLPRPL